MQCPKLSPEQCPPLRWCLALDMSVFGLCLLLNIDFDFLCKFSFTASVSEASGKRPLGPGYKLTYHKKGDCEVFPSLSFHCTKDGANNGAADADEGDHDDEPADGDSLGDGKTTAGL